MDIKQRISQILSAEADAIATVKVTSAFEEAVNALRGCRGKVIATGIGKAGLAAKKFAATLCSTATPAAFIHPAEAAHGDLGLLDERDVVVAFSTSGKSREVVEMLEMSRHLKITTIIGITSHPDSQLRELANIILDMGIIEEVCPLGLTPTSSTVVMMAISDALAVTLMELKGVTKQDYYVRHHGGYLGRKARADNVS
jgi:arabinose-5-phosphate isomerase